MSASRAELIVFDLGGVLVDVAAGWAEACTRAGVPLPAALSDPATRQAIQRVYKAAEVGQLDADAFLAQAAQLAQISREDMHRVSSAFLCGALPGAAALLDELRAAGAVCACLSNTMEHHWRLLTQPGGFCGLSLHALPHRFASHEIGAAKPDADAYQHVERVTGFSGACVTFFDDRAENCEAAQRCGWRATRIDPDRAPIAQIRAALAR